MAQVSGKNVLCIPVLNDQERLEVLKVAGELGPDPSSKDFATRTKNIGFVLCVDGEWYQVNRNYFQQSKFYNDLSGGYRRYYRELPREFIENEIVQTMLNKFKKIHNIPDGRLILLHVQASLVRPGDKVKCLTGHGIHTDGVDKAMLLCLNRKNVKGALNSFYGDPDGKEVIREPFVLKEGYACFWEDNRIYHHASPAEPEDGAGIGERTVIVGVYPGKYFLHGVENPNNTLKRSPS